MADCPNDRKRLNCILCGKDTHDSFECTEKLCFRCNKVGHKANECESEDIVKCNQCGITGHTQTRCLKIWHVQTDGSGQQIRFAAKQQHLMRCVECGKQGHLKCTSFKRSSRAKIDFKIRNNIESFFKKSSKSHSDVFNAEESSASIQSYGDSSDEGDDL